MFLLSRPVQSHGSGVRSPVLHVHHAGFLYVLDGLWHLLLFLIQCKHTAESHHLHPPVNEFNAQTVAAPTFIIIPACSIALKKRRRRRRVWVKYVFLLCVLLTHYWGYYTRYLLCSMKQPVGQIKEITKQSEKTAVSCDETVEGGQGGYVLFSV